MLKKTATAGEVRIPNYSSKFAVRSQRSNAPPSAFGLLRVRMTMQQHVWLFKPMRQH
jgi:hypothetical protein